MLTFPIIACSSYCLILLLYFFFRLGGGRTFQHLSSVFMASFLYSVMATPLMFFFKSHIYLQSVMIQRANRRRKKKKEKHGLLRSAH
jgi:hypothetical protein